MSKKYTLLTFKGICMNFLLKLKFFILGHPVTSKQPHKIVPILLGHPVHCIRKPLHSVSEQNVRFYYKGLFCIHEMYNTKYKYTQCAKS